MSDERRVRKIRRKLTMTVLLSLAAFPGVVRAQTVGAAGTGAGSTGVIAGQGLPETLEAIAAARVQTRILYVTAHPDDERSSILTYLARGLHAEVALLAVTRGEGGQNALGPEYGPRLAILRSEELLRATQIYGVKLFFTRAPDFGFSKSVEETKRIWGDRALADMVAVVRTFRPHIIINNWGGVRTGHGHHQTAGLLTPEAFDAAGDAQKYPEQVAAGLPPWKPMYLLQMTRNFGTDNDAGSIAIPANEVSPLWGRNYTEIGVEGYSSHRTQGVAGFRNLSFFRGNPSLALAKGGEPKAFSLRMFQEPLDAQSLGVPEKTMDTVSSALGEAFEAAKALKWRESVAGLRAAAATLAQAPADASSDAANKKWEVRHALDKIHAALTLAAGLQVEVIADRVEVVTGSKFTFRTLTQCRAELNCKFGELKLEGPAGASLQVGKDERGEARWEVTLNKDLRSTAQANDWMLPVPAPFLLVNQPVTIGDTTIPVRVPVKSARATSTKLDALPVQLVPEVTLTVEPKQFVVKTGDGVKPLELLTRVHHYGTQSANFSVGVDAPTGWKVSSTPMLNFSGTGDELVKFTVTPPTKPTAGHFALKAWAKAVDGTEFRTSLEPLPTLPTRSYSEPAEAKVEVFALNVPANLRVGYVTAENDPVPAALRGIGMQVELLDEVALAFGDLKKYDAIAIGIRAYELRGDLARANRRLLEYAAAGGTLLVQYQRNNDWDRIAPAPYPATMGNSTVRVAEENSPVRIADAAHPLLNTPNKITAADFEGWIQERGTNFLSKWDAHYQTPLGMHDTGEPEALGSLVYAQHGKGVFIYTGISFFRQLPEGVPGAYRLIVNLLGQSKATSHLKNQGSGN